MISLQVTQELMDEFDKVWGKLNFSSRSEALRESILFFIQNHKESMSIEGHKVAVINVHHEVREDILDKFSEYMAKYENIIKSVNAYNLKTRVIKILIVSGAAQEINDLYNLFVADRFFTTTISYIILGEAEKKD